MRKTVYIFLLLTIPLSLNAYTFTRSLTIGSQGQDVVELQKYLNSNELTKVSESGVGSTGFETSYFGDKTKQAVIKFQNLFASSILHPLGLSTGSGFVGNSTISFLNRIQGNTSQTNTTLTTNVAQINKNLPVIGSVSPESVGGKETIAIIGSNFSSLNNQIIFGFEGKDDYRNIKSTSNGTKIEVDYVSSIQKIYDEKYGSVSKKAKERMLEEFPEIEVAVSVITESGQSNFKIIKFKLK